MISRDEIILTTGSFPARRETAEKPNFLRLVRLVRPGNSVSPHVPEKIPMTCMFTRLAAFSIVLVACVDTNGQDFHSRWGHGDAHGNRFGHDYWHHQTHSPDVVQLDTYADQLAKVVRHLHEDAHKLSQDYEHSESIEYYVDQVDRLQQHMHEILHQAAQSGQQSWSLVDHVKSDIRQVSRLLSRLYGELQHQGYDGARTEDFYAMNHMRQVLVSEAFPLVRQTEIELYGYALGGHRFESHRQSLDSTRWEGPRIRLGH